MEMRRRQPLGVELVKRGVVTGTDIENALRYQKTHPNKKIGDILYILNAGDPEKLIQIIGDIVGVKGILLNSRQLKVRVEDYFTLDIARKNKAIPFELMNGHLKVCFANTADSSNIENIRFLLSNKNITMESYITFESEIDKILVSLQPVKDEDSGVLKQQKDESITNLVDNIFKLAMTRRASDIHIEPLAEEIRVRYRIDGELFTAASIKKEKQSQIIGRLKAISNMHQEKQESQDGRILMYEDFNVRSSSQPNVHGEKFVMRLLKKTANIKNIFELGLPGTDEDLRQAINKKNSVTVIAAPTGEGKTSTLYSIIDYLNKPEINVTTIEDPVEIRINGLNQIEIDNRSSFSGALRTVLRQDPDVILVGEIRDKETGEIAIQAGQTGHYVLSTIHTIDAVEVITRLRKMGLSDYDISSTVSTAISQRLVRKLCDDCKKHREYRKDELDIIKKMGDKYNFKFDTSKGTYDAVGCKKCSNTGYFSRVGVFEVLDITDELKEDIVNSKSSIEIRKNAIENTNYRPLVIDGIRKVTLGDTTLEELNKKLLFF